MIFYIPPKLCGDTFACKNGSLCKAGDGSEIDQQHKHLDLLSSIKSHVDGTNYYCECPPGFIGHDCAVEVKECLSSERQDLVHSCYFGSECIEADNEYGLLDKFCDCSMAKREDGKLVAGLMCEHTSSTTCSDDGKDAATASDAYCTNGGTCKRIVSSGEDFPGCNCEGTWDGKHCEFADGVLKDDALDLFSVRKAEILYEENLNGLGSTATRVSDANVESKSFKFISFAVSFGVVVGVGVSLIMMIVVRRIRNLKRELLPDDDSDCFTTYDGQVPPPNVFSSSRKKEVEDDSDDESTMFDTEHHDKYEDDVEMLDEATSRILESQFERSEEDGAEEELVRQGHDFASPSYYDHEDEALDRGDRPRITVNNGQFLLTSVANENDYPSAMSSVMSLDGDDDVDNSDQPNIVSLDGDDSYDDNDDGASNYKILTYV